MNSLENITKGEYTNRFKRMKSSKLVKTIALSLGLLVGIIGISRRAEAFPSQTIDPGDIATTPAFAIDQSNGLQHLVWGRENVFPAELVYANSSDNFTTQNIIDTREFYANPDMAVDSNGNVHISFSAQVGSWRDYYINSIDWIVKPLHLNNGDGYETSIALDNNKLYIAMVDNGDILIAESIDYETFNYTQIIKSNHQMNPSIDIDSNNIVHLVYWDWSDGVENGCGQYKTRYRSSLDGFVNEENISTARQSYGACLKVDSLDNIWVNFKDSTYFPDSFDRGDVFLADRNSNWNKRRITPDSIDFMQDRPTSLAIDRLDRKHITWSEVDWNDSTVSILYVNSLNLNRLQVTAFGYDIGKGWSVVDTDNIFPYIAANVNSLVNYSLPATVPIRLVGLGILGGGLLSVGYIGIRKKFNKDER